jgi:hypothetical protein
VTVPGVYRRDDAGWERIATGPSMVAMLTEVAEKAKGYAVSISPYDPTPDDNGHYRDSFQVEHDTWTIGGFRRAITRLRNTAPYAAAVEWGYKGRAGAPDVDAHRVLGRTLAHLGGLR